MSGSSGILPQLAWPRPVWQGLWEGRNIRDEVHKLVAYIEENLRASSLAGLNFIDTSAVEIFDGPLRYDAHLLERRFRGVCDGRAVPRSAHSVEVNAQTPPTSYSGRRRRSVEILDSRTHRMRISARVD